MMQSYFIYFLIAVIIVLIGWFIFSKVLKNKTPKGVDNKKIPVDLDLLIDALGKIDNIQDSQANGSKITFYLYNDDLVNVEQLKQLGASGIIQATGKITVIMGKFSTEISEMIKQRQ